MLYTYNSYNYVSYITVKMFFKKDRKEEDDGRKERENRDGKQRKEERRQRVHSESVKKTIKGELKR